MGNAPLPGVDAPLSGCKKDSNCIFRWPKSLKTKVDGNSPRQTKCVVYWYIYYLNVELTAMLEAAGLLEFYLASLMFSTVLELWPSWGHSLRNRKWHLCTILLKPAWHKFPPKNCKIEPNDFTYIIYNERIPNYIYTCWRHQYLLFAGTLKHLKLNSTIPKKWKHQISKHHQIQSDRIQVSQCMLHHHYAFV